MAAGADVTTLATTWYLGYLSIRAYHGYLAYSGCTTTVVTLPLPWVLGYRYPSDYDKAPWLLWNRDYLGTLASVVTSATRAFLAIVLLWVCRVCSGAYGGYRGHCGHSDYRRVLWLLWRLRWPPWLLQPP